VVIQESSRSDFWIHSDSVTPRRAPLKGAGSRISLVRVVGVIDLKDGQAVHARGGRRERYAPVHQSAGLVVDGNPLALAQLYVDTFGLSEIYLADLDAIASRTLQAGTIRGISKVGAAVWLDAGIVQADEANSVLEAGAQTLVVGLETLASFDVLADICAQSDRPVAFSLDLRDGAPMGGRAAASYPPEQIARLAAAAGATSIIVLDVTRVGTGDGPDVEMLRRIHSVVPAVQLFAGGGIRGIDDLRQVAHIGCAGALVATALHEGRLTPGDVAALKTF
jgi:phosphoribosylformimino-5-aminoimidazole carboxamide ribotide isomerase